MSDDSNNVAPNDGAADSVSARDEWVDVPNEKEEVDQVSPSADTGSKLPRPSDDAVPANVVIEFPSAVAASNLETTSSDVEHKKSSQFPAPMERLGDDQSLSSSCSFVRTVGNLKIQDEAGAASRKQPPVVGLDSFRLASATASDDASSVSSWASVSLNLNRPTSVATASTPQTDNGSTISGFDILSLGTNGATYVSCPHCSLRNDVAATVCGGGSELLGCGLPLVANPNLDMDEQIARRLQKQEEDQSFQSLVDQEKKRKTMEEQPLLVRSSILARDICNCATSFCVQQSSKDPIAPSCCFTLPEASLQVLASRFIDVVDKYKKGLMRLSLVYHFASKSTLRMTQIRQDGFGPHKSFYVDILVAYQNAMVFSSTIPEEKPESVSAEDNRLGWLVLLAERRGVKDSLHVPKVRSIDDSSQALPLAYFEPSLRHDKDVIQDLLQGMRQVCFDYFEVSPEAAGTRGSTLAAKKAKPTQVSLAVGNPNQDPHPATETR